MIKISYQLNRLWHFGLPVKLHTKQSHPTISMANTKITKERRKIANVKS